MPACAELPFDSIYRHGFARCAVAQPKVRVADPRHNASQVVLHSRQAAERGAVVVVFPELVLSSYAVDDLFHQTALIEACDEALRQVAEETSDLGALLLVGLPVRSDGRLFIGAAVLCRGRLLGVVPKCYLPNYREYYEKRQFTRARAGLAHEIMVAGQEAPFGSAIFRARDLPLLKVFPEICEDLWTPVPPSTWGALAGANVLCNLSASNATVAKADYRGTICAAQSGRCVAAYLYAGAGSGESTTDLAWDGHGMIWENAVCLARSRRYASEGQTIFADVDLERLEVDRMRLTSFQDSVEDYRAQVQDFPTVDFDLGLEGVERPLERAVPRFPYVPSDDARRHERCGEVYRIQVAGLLQRLQASGIDKVVIGVSGGLDSTQALLVAVRAFDDLGLPRRNILGYSLPGLATSERTRSNALALMEVLGVTVSEIDISDAARGMLERIGHPAVQGEPLYDTTFENVQAGERTSHLFRLANRHGALVLGTGDLSELALGWCTYGVGDQMSHYNVNASVPKTLIQHLIRWVAENDELGRSARETLSSIVGTEISPELVPHGGDGAEPAQKTEELVGPFELQDFHLYYTTRFGFRPSKIAYLAWNAWRDVRQGRWPESLPVERRHEYELSEIKRWLEVFLSRFFETSQFKRSAIPNGPKVGSGGSLSPRGDWRAPSDSSARVWLDELAENVP